MQIHQLIFSQSDISSGNSSSVIITSKDKGQLEELCLELNTKFGESSDVYYCGYDVESIDFDLIPESLSTEKYQKILQEG